MKDFWVGLLEEASHRWLVLLALTMAGFLAVVLWGPALGMPRGLQFLANCGATVLTFRVAFFIARSSRPHDGFVDLEELTPGELEQLHNGLFSSDVEAGSAPRRLRIRVSVRGDTPPVLWIR